MSHENSPRSPVLYFEDDFASMQNVRRVDNSLVSSTITWCNEVALKVIFTIARSV